MVAKDEYDLKYMAKRLRALRIEAGFSQQELAKRMGRSRGAIDAVEKGLTLKDGPGIRTLDRWCRACGTTLGEFFGAPEPRDFTLPFEYDPVNVRLYQWLSEILNSERGHLYTGIFTNLECIAFFERHAPRPPKERKPTKGKLLHMDKDKDKRSK